MEWPQDHATPGAFSQQALVLSVASSSTHEGELEFSREGKLLQFWRNFSPSEQAARLRARIRRPGPKS